MSLENLLMILPAGVTSKKDIGENRILFSIMSCSCDDPANSRMANDTALMMPRITMMIRLTPNIS